VTALLAISALVAALVALVLAYIGGLLHGSRIRRQALREAREPYLRELAELQVRQEELVRLARQWAAGAAGDPLDLYTLARRACGEVVLEFLRAPAEDKAGGPWKPVVVVGGRGKREGRA
jgi:hypothetical protein